MCSSLVNFSENIIWNSSFFPIHDGLPTSVQNSKKIWSSTLKKMKSWIQYVRKWCVSILPFYHLFSALFSWLSVFIYLFFTIRFEFQCIFVVVFTGLLWMWDKTYDHFIGYNIFSFCGETFQNSSWSKNASCPIFEGFERRADLPKSL